MAGTQERPIPRVLKHYRLGREVGRGGTGVVFEARDRRDNSRVAVKVLHPDLAWGQEGYRERFEREAHVAALLRSPYTVHLLDFGVIDERYFLVMEFVEGQSITGLIQAGPIEPLRALRITSDVAHALEEAEARGVVHRDIKPDNVLIAPDGSVKVADFGIARQRSVGPMTIAGTFVGTPSFAAPEQLRGDADQRTDIYALGATLYTMLAGRPPFEGASVIEILHQQERASVPMAPLSGLPDQIVNLIRRCMEKDPLDRYQSASEMLGALQRATNALQTWTPAVRPPAPVPAPPPAAASDAPTVARRRSPARPPAADVTTRLGEAAGVEEPTVVEADLGATQPASAVTGETVVEAELSETPPVPALAATPAGSTTIELALKAKAKKAGVGTTTYELLIRNAGGEWANAQIVANDPEGACAISAPAQAAVAPHSTTSVELTVKPLHPRLRGDRQRRRFVVSTSGGGAGVPPAIVEGEFDDIPYGRLLFGGLLGAAALVAVLTAGAVFALGGDDGGTTPAAPSETSEPVTKAGASGGSPASSPSATGSPGAIGSATASPSTSAAVSTPAGAAGASPAAIPTPVPPPTTKPTVAQPTTVPPTATKVPPTPTAGPPARSIVAGEWDYDFVVQSNNCGSGLSPGQRVQASYEMEDATNGDDYITVGERVDVWQGGTGSYLGNFLFSFPDFEIRYNLLDQYGSVIGGAILTNHYNTASNGTATLLEQYGFGSSACYIYLSE